MDASFCDSRVPTPPECRGRVTVFCATFFAKHPDRETGAGRGEVGPTRMLGIGAERHLQDLRLGFQIGKSLAGRCQPRFDARQFFHSGFSSESKFMTRNATMRTPFFDSGSRRIPNRHFHLLTQISLSPGASSHLLPTWIPTRCLGCLLYLGTVGTYEYVIT